MTDVEQFFALLYAHSPEKSFYFVNRIHKPTQTARPKFFRSKSELIQDVLNAGTGTGDYYFSPASYHRPTRPIKSNVAGASVVWVDCDNGLPEFDQTPNVLVETSPNHFHAYWSLTEFKTPEEIEAINKELAERFNTDRSGWDSTQLLRPPGSVNRKRGDYHSKVVRIQTDTQASFKVTIPDKANASPTGGIDTGKLLASLVMTQKTRELLFEKAIAANGEGRSGVAFEAACALVSMKLKDDEIRALLLLQDERLQRLVGRQDRDAQIQQLIDTARKKEKVPPPVGEEDRRPLYDKWVGNQQFLLADIGEDDAILQHFIYKEGIVILGGEPAAGKSRMALQMLDSICCGKSFLGKEVPEPVPCCYLSLDMNNRRVREIRRKQEHGFTDKEKELIEKNLHLFIRGRGLDLTDPKLQARVRDDFLSVQAVVIVIDVLARAVPSLLDDVLASKFLDWIQTMVVEDHLSFLFVTHTRKSSVGIKIHHELDDLYGSRHWSITPDGCFILESKGKQDNRLIITKDRSGELDNNIDLYKDYGHSLFLLKSSEQKVAEQKELDDVNAPGTETKL
jgi:hypothetical protein